MSSKQTMIINADDFSTLQDAANAVPEHGTLLIPKGTRNCLPFHLHSHMTLQFEQGARLIASRDIRDYSPLQELKRESSIGHGFLWGSNLEDVTIDGGIIDASGDAFWKDFDGAPSPEPSTYRTKIYKPAPKRPTAIIFYNCRNLILKNLTILNSPSYTVWLIGCQNVHIENVTIQNHRLSPNTDGLDIDCCTDVWIHGCNLQCGDDCIAVKSDISLIGEDRPCERIVISDCILTCPCCGIRVGYEGDGVIRDMVVSNMVIHHCNKGLDFISLIPDNALPIRKGARIENILFTNIAMRDVRQGISIWSYTDHPKDQPNYAGWIRQIKFSHMTIEATDASFIGGLNVSEITLEDIKMNVKRDMSRYKGEEPVEITNVWGVGYLPNPLTLYHADDTRLTNVSVQEEIISEA